MLNLSHVRCCSLYRATEVCDYAAVEKAVTETFEAVAAKVAAPADPATEMPLFVDGSDNQDGSHE